ncbi:MAG: 2-oxoisovalerate dehydrogenase [Methylococcales bacterium]
MIELIFVVEEDPEGGYAAKALGESIYTHGENLEELHKNVRYAVSCHFDEGQGPSMVRLHFVKEEILAL